jgi:gliding motility-associated-like protein
MVHARFGILLLSFLLLVRQANGQQISCPTNIDFEQGLGSWTFYTGSCCPISANTLTGAINNRHTWTSGVATDPYGGFPVVSPGGGLHSLKLGNNSVNSQAERATYTFTVPTGVNNYSLIYRYAVVFEDPQHATADQPRFQVRAYDTATNTTIPCSQHTYVASSSLPGFSLSPLGSSVLYHPWTMGTINLSGYAGQTITIEFATGDCALGAHFGYGYVDMNCSLFQISTNNCSNSPTTTLTAPPGYQYYTWMNDNYTTTVDTGQNITIATPATTTTYHVILTPFNGLGCVDTLTTTVNISNLTLTATNDTVACAGTPLALQATATSNAGPISYAWSPATGLSCTACSNPIATPTTGTLYYVTVTDSNGCTKTDSVRVRVDSLELAVTKQDLLCFGSSNGTATAVLSKGIGAYNYSWNTAPIQHTNVVSNLSAGTYTITGSDSFCTKSSTITINQPPQLNASVSTVNVTCFGHTNGSATASVSGGVTPYTYAWTGSTATAATAANLAYGSYQLTVTDNNGCTDTVSFTIAQPPAVQVTIASKVDVSCFGGANGLATAAGSGGTTPYTYSWSTNPTQTTATAGNLSPGTYTVLLTDNNGCTDTAQATITQPLPLNATVTSVTPVNCITAANGSATAAATGGTTPYAFSWSTTPPQNTASAINLPVGTYTCTVTDNKGCMTSVSAAILNPNPLVVAIPTPSVINCFGDSTGTASAAVSGGRPPYSYSWSTSPVQSTPIATGLKAGLYTVIITDSVGCADTAQTTVTQQPDIVINTSSLPTCPNTSQGSATVSASGGVSPYIYQWNTTPSQSGSSPSNMAAGVYTVTVTDSKGCKKKATVTVDTFTAPNVIARGDTILCAGSPVQLYASGAGSYQWSPSASLSCASCATPYANPSAQTIYTVVGTDANNCKDTDQVVITVLHRVPVDAGGDHEVCEGASVRLEASGGVAYAWQPATSLSNSQSAAPLASPSTTTTYMVIITENECFADTLYQTVVVEPYPTIDLGPDLRALPGASLYLKADTSHAVSILWTPATGLNCDQCDKPVAVVEKTIMYKATVHNRLGCEASDELTITMGCDNSTFYMANTFTPNADGLNDVYFPRGRGADQINHFMIYNRWGELMYEARNFPCNDERYGWNGTYKNEPMKADVYVYVLEATCGNDERVLLKGDITLYR